jgi:hypothetical protein
MENISVRCTFSKMALFFLQIFRCAAPYTLMVKQQSCEIFVEIRLKSRSKVQRTEIY